jgi:hypothetical protein
MSLAKCKSARPDCFFCRDKIEDGMKFKSSRPHGGPVVWEDGGEARLLPDCAKERHEKAARLYANISGLLWQETAEGPI